VKNAVGDVIILNEVKDLGFVNVARVGQRVENAVGIGCIALSIPGVKAPLRVPADGIFAASRQRGEEILLPLVESLL
jgi:hypothetical protein